MHIQKNDEKDVTKQSLRQLVKNLKSSKKEISRIKKKIKVLQHEFQKKGQREFINDDTTNLYKEKEQQLSREFDHYVNIFWHVRNRIKTVLLKRMIYLLFIVLILNWLIASCS